MSAAAAALLLTAIAGWLPAALPTPALVPAADPPAIETPTAAPVTVPPVAAMSVNAASAKSTVTDAVAPPAAIEAAPRSHAEEFSQEHLQWLQEVALLITPEERTAFLSLARAYQREAYIRTFWRSRDPYPDTARNELRYRWEERVTLARRMFGTVLDRRARVLLLNGEPVLRCVQVGSERSQVRRREIWFYSYSELYSGQFALIFFQDEHGRWELWDPWNVRAGSRSGLGGGRPLRRGGGGGLEVELPGGAGVAAPAGPWQDAAFALSDTGGAGSSCPLSSAGVNPQIAGRPPGEEPGNRISGNVLRKLFGAEIPQDCLEANAAAMKMIQTLCSGGSCLEYSLMLARIQTPPPPPNREWLPTFTSFSTEVPPDSGTFEAGLAYAFPGWYGQRTILEGAVRVPLAQVELSELGGHRAYNFVLNGEVLRGDELFDNFRYRFDVPANTLAGGPSLPLLFQRYLRAGDYTVILRVEDLASGHFFRSERAVRVPPADETSALTSLVNVDPETARLLAEANAAIAAGESSIRIVKPLGTLLTGLVRFDTQVVGDNVAKVVFAVEGRPILTKTEPPYSVELDLGSLPRLLTLSAVALDAEGREIANDELIVNSGGYRFVIRLVEPRRGGQHTGAVRTRATVEVPEGESLDRVELYLNEDLVATLYGPPLVQNILLPNDEVAYVRAVAYLHNGDQTEDAAWINARGFIDDLDVQFVELYTLVLDRDRRPVADLEEGDFAVSEDGVAQQIRRFETVENRAIRAAILLDTSASMETHLGTAKQAALAFFEQTVEPRDRLGLITFSDRPRLAVQFTNDRSAFGGGLAGLKCEGGTALYDSVIYSLFYFDGVQGQRALLVISDGEDERSRYGFEEALEYAQRAGVTIYTIGIDLARREAGIRRKLSRLAEETGGRGFFIESVDELTAVYDVIQQELRARYLIAYQSTNSSDEGFRAVEVDVARRGLEATTLRGYFP